MNDINDMIRTNHITRHNTYYITHITGNLKKQKLRVLLAEKE